MFTLLRYCLSLLLLTLLSSGLAADPPRVGLVLKSMANPFFKTMAEGAKSHAATRTGEYVLLIEGIDNETDKASQIRLIEKLISSRVQGLVIAPADSRDLVPVVRKALAAGILVINIDNKLDDRLLTEHGINVPFIGPSNRLGAREVGSYLGRQLRGGDKVAIIEGISTTTNALARTAGFSEAMNAAGMEVVAVRSAQWETSIAREVATALLREQPDLKALLCGNDSMAIGAIAAVQAARRPVLVVGYDNIPAVRPLLLNGQLLATADQFGSQQAVFGIELVLKTLRDKTEQAALPAMVQTPVKLVTK